MMRRRFGLLHCGDGYIVKKVVKLKRMGNILTFTKNAMIEIKTTISEPDVRILEDMLESECSQFKTGQSHNCYINFELIQANLMYYPHNKSQQYFVYLLMLSNNVVGYVEWREDGVQSAHILGFYIDSKLRNNGLGSKFYCLLEENLGKMGYLNISLSCDNKDARRFWLDKCMFVEDEDDIFRKVKM